METDQWTRAEALSAIETVTSRNQMAVLHQREQVEQSNWRTTPPAPSHPDADT